MLKYPLQVSDHTHTTERDTPYLHAEIPTTSQWSHTQQKEIHHTYMLKYPLQVSDHTHNTHTHTQQKEIHHIYMLKYPLQVSDHTHNTHTHTTERDTPYLHTKIPTTSQWSHTQQKEIHHTYMLKYPLQVSDHTHNRKRYTIPTYWNTHYKSVITYTTERDTPYLHTEIPTTSQWSHTTTERDTPYLHTEIPTTSQWSHTQQKEIHHSYMLKYPLQVSDHIHNRKR